MVNSYDPHKLSGLAVGLTGSARLQRSKKLRGTKVVATSGPASDPLIEALIVAGVDVFRLNFSHGSHEEHESRIRKIRSAAEKVGRYVAILGDLQGPKIRIGGFSAGSITLKKGAQFSIDPNLNSDAGDERQVNTGYDRLAEQVNAGDVLILGDGEIELRVLDIAGARINCQVQVGGQLSAGKGINLRGGGLSVAALTAKDYEDLEFSCQQKLDYVAVSFVRGAHELRRVRELALSHDCRCGVVAKLERSEAVLSNETLDEIIETSDAVMVARGDLAIEIGDAQLMGTQKRIIKRARELNRTVITATQMMESMVASPKPTRAEVMDVANAVLDGTDAVMLSGETAMGRYPVEAVEHMVNVIKGAESADVADSLQVEYRCETIDESVAMAAMVVADQLAGVRAVACLTASGNTPKLMSRRRSRLPIYALADNPATLARVALIRGVHPRLFLSDSIDFEMVNEAALNKLKTDGAVMSGDRVVITKGDLRNVQGGTNTMKIVEVA